MLASGLFERFLGSVAFMPCFDHIDESRLMAFYRLWNRSPELVSDEEFDDIQLHLLECEDCALIARRCEEKMRPLLLLPASETN